MGCSSSKDGSAPSKKPTVKEGEVACGSHLKTPECLTGFPVFPKDCSSMLKKHLSKDIWNEYHDKADAAGVSFKTCVFSGCQNTDSGIGIYAGSHDSYTPFAHMFDKVIEDYHKHGKEAKHVSDMDASALNCPPLDEEDAAMIVSTRIRVGRNLKDYPLGPGVTKEQRNEIMNKVVEACGHFEGDLKGKFYSLDSLSDDDRKQLIDDHFLFK